MHLGIKFVFAVFIAGVAPVAQSASAAVVTFNAGYEFSGGAVPVGATSWLTVSFNDGGAAGSVVMTVSNSGLTNTEFVSQLNFNLDPALSVANLTVGAFNTTGAFALPTVAKSANGFNIAGSGRYDVEFDFATSNSGGGAQRFGAGESFSVTLAGIPTLTANSFNFNSTGGGNGAYPFAAHVQSINGNDSGWVSQAAVPEPASIALLAAGPLAMLARRRRVAQ